MRLTWRKAVVLAVAAWLAVCVWALVAWHWPDHGYNGPTVTVPSK
jgi:hypothetical protein